MMSMGLKRRWVVSLLGGVLAHAGAVAAQQPSDAPQQNAQQPASGASGETLQEVIVTANRREQSIQDVPISVAAVTDQNIQDQGIKTANDLVQMVPALSISSNNGGNSGFSGNPNVSIRGITSTVGASTTGIYLDDVPLQVRNAGAACGGVSAIVRPGSRRGAARPAGHAVRWLLGGRHAAFHQSGPELHQGLDVRSPGGIGDAGGRSECRSWCRRGRPAHR